MAVRRIALTEEAYRRLRSRRTAGESFSDVILRLTRRPPLGDFVGTLSPKTANAMRKAIEEDEARRRRLDERQQSLKRASSSTLRQETAACA